MQYYQWYSYVTFICNIQRGLNPTTSIILNVLTSLYILNDVVNIKWETTCLRDHKKDARTPWSAFLKTSKSWDEGKYLDFSHEDVEHLKQIKMIYLLN